MFDDDRATTALRALARLSERTQVIFFTHHEHLVQIARDTLDNGILRALWPVSIEMTKVGVS